MMPAYQTRSHQPSSGALPERRRRIREFLEAHPVGVLASVTPQAKPHGSVIYFRLDDDFAVSFLTKKLTAKYANLRECNDVMLTVFDAATQTASQIVGSAEEILDSYQINGIADAILSASIRTSLSGVPPIGKLEAGEYAAFTVRPEQIRLAIYGEPGAGIGPVFDSLESFELEEPLA